MFSIYICGACFYFSDLPVEKNTSNKLIVTITGVNCNIEIHTIVHLPQTAAMETTFLDLINGNLHPRQPQSPLTNSSRVLHTILGRGAQLRSKRLLFVLDLFSYGQGQTEVTLNRAYLLPVT